MFYYIFATHFETLILYSVFGTYDDISFMWMPQSITNEKPTLVQVMTCYHQEINHYPRKLIANNVALICHCE